MLAAPAKSKCLRSASERLSAMSDGAMAAAIRPIGTLTHSTHCQPSPSVSTPPSSTPAAPPLPATAPHTPSALVRSGPSRNGVVTIDRAAGERMAAPSPCTARAAISWPESTASPPAREASADSTSPDMKTARLPSRSAARPPSRRNPPNVSTYAFTTQGRSLSVNLSASPIVGSATLTIEASSTTTNCATQRRIKAIQRRSWAAERFERLRDVALEAIADDDPWESFAGFMRASARIQTDDRALSEVLTSRPDTMRRAAEAVDILGLVGQILGRAQAAGAVRADAHPYDVPMLMCALAGTFRNPHADPERYIGITLDGLRAPGAELTKLPAVEAE